MGFTTSQWISSLVLVASIIFYFGANTGIKQNAFLYVFGVALTVLVVGKVFIINKDFLFMNERGFEYEPHYDNWQKRRDAENEAWFFVYCIFFISFYQYFLVHICLDLNSLKRSLFIQISSKDHTVKLRFAKILTYKYLFSKNC